MKIEKKDLNEIDVDGEQRPRKTQRSPETQRTPETRRRPPETRRQQQSNGDGRSSDEIERERESLDLRERD